MISSRLSIVIMSPHTVLGLRTVYLEGGEGVRCNLKVGDLHFLEIQLEEGPFKYQPAEGENLPDALVLPLCR
jgi:hypothetical protein